MVADAQPSERHLASDAYLDAYLGDTPPTSMDCLDDRRDETAGQ